MRPVAPILSAALLLAALLLAAPLLAAPSPPAMAAAEPNAICIATYNIDHTEITDDSTILFYMRDGSVYRNRLPYRCSGLRSATGGFTYEPSDPATQELCGNLGIFRVNQPTGVGFSTGSVCAFGPFDRIAAPHR